MTTRYRLASLPPEEVRTTILTIPGLYQNIDVMKGLIPEKINAIRKIKHQNDPLSNLYEGEPFQHLGVQWPTRQHAITYVKLLFTQRDATIEQHSKQRDDHLQKGPGMVYDFGVEHGDRQLELTWITHSEKPVMEVIISSAFQCPRFVNALLQPGIEQIRYEDPRTPYLFGRRTNNLMGGYLLEANVLISGLIKQARIYKWSGHRFQRSPEYWGEGFPPDMVPRPIIDYATNNQLLEKEYPTQRTYKDAKTKPWGDPIFI